MTSEVEIDAASTSPTSGEQGYPARDPARPEDSRSGDRSDPHSRVTSFDTVWVGGVPFASATIPDAVQWVLSSERRLAPLNVRLANAYTVALGSRNSGYGTILRNSGVNFPDGTPVVWFMRLLAAQGTARTGRVRGPSFFVETLRASAHLETRHFFLGATPETLDRLTAEIEQRFPGVKIVGTYSPPFAPIDDEYIDDCVARVVETQADLVWIGLGTPKQDILGTEFSRRAKVTSVNVGAAFDFTAGSVQEAPDWIQRSGFEWLYRLSREPRRLWRRYLIGNLQFLGTVATHWRTPVRRDANEVRAWSGRPAMEKERPE